MPKTLKLRAGSVDLAHGRVYRRETRVALTTLEAGLLSFLADRPGEEVSRDTLLEAVWDQSTAVITRAVDNTVTRLRAKIEVDPKDPDHIVTVRGVGYRFEPLGAGDLPELREAPESNDPILGRDDALITLEAMLREGASPLTITGPGGIGKTRLSKALGHTLAASNLVREVLFVDLSEASTSEEMRVAIARAFGVPQVDPDGLALLPALRGRTQDLLILDNAEQLRHEVRTLIAGWREPVPGLNIVVTSRIRLGLPEEGVFTLGPLDSEAAIALFIERGKRVKHGYAPQGMEREAVEDLVTHLDKLPLAIELAAGRVDILGPRDLLERIDAQLGLTGQRPGDTPRRETLRGTIAWSWDLLTPAHQGALAQASLFRGGFTLDGAEAVLELPGETSVAEAITHLREASLLQATPQLGGRLRYGFLESIRHFALAHLGDESAEGARTRYRGFYQGRSQALAREIRGPEGVQASLELLAEEENILESFRGCLGAGDGRGAAALLLSLRTIALTRGPADAYQERVTLALNALPKDGISTTPEALDLGLFRGELCQILGHHQDAKEAFLGVQDAALPWPETRDLQQRAIEASARLGYLKAFGGAISAGLERLETAMSRAKALRDRALEALILDRIGSIHHLRWDLPAARRALTRALALHRRAKDTSAATRAASNLGLIDLEEGRFERSRVRLSASADLDASLGNRRSEALQRLNLGALALELGEYQSAEASLLQSLNLAQGAGDRRTEGLVRIDLTLLFAETGRMLEARGEGEEAELTFEDLEEPFFTGLALAHLGAVYALDGDGAAAKDTFERAAKRLPPPEAHPTIQAALALMAAWDHCQGDNAAAQKRVAPLLEGSDPLVNRSSYARLVLRFLKQMGVLGSEFAHP